MESGPMDVVARNAQLARAIATEVATSLQPHSPPEGIPTPKARNKLLMDGSTGIRSSSGPGARAAILSPNTGELPAQAEKRLFPCYPNKQLRMLRGTCALLYPKMGPVSRRSRFKWRLRSRKMCLGVSAGPCGQTYPAGFADLDDL